MPVDLNKDTTNEFDFADFEDDNPLDIKPISKKSLVIFFLVDTSGSMSGTKIATLNNVMEELLPELVGVGGSNTDIKLAVMTFSDGHAWVTQEPMSIDDYQYWTRLNANGLTDLGGAFVELSKKLSRNAFLTSPSISYAPVIFLLTDGYATDDVYGGLDTLQRNNWYKYGLKIALGIGDKFDKELLERFTGNTELVLTAKSPDQLARLVKTIAIKSSQIGGQSMPLVKEGSKELEEEDVFKKKEETLVNEIKQEAEEFPEDFEVDEGWGDL